MLASPGQNPKLATSWEYASDVTAFAPGIGGARRPENRVSARSKECQKKCTGLVLHEARPANSSSTQAVQRRIAVNFATETVS